MNCRICRANLAYKVTLYNVIANKTYRGQGDPGEGAHAVCAIFLWSPLNWPRYANIIFHTPPFLNPGSAPGWGPVNKCFPPLYVWRPEPGLEDSIGEE